MIHGLLSENKAADAIGISRWLLKGARDKGEGPSYVTFRGRVYYREQEVRQWFEAQLTNHPAGAAQPTTTKVSHAKQPNSRKRNHGAWGHQAVARSRP